MAYGTLIDNIRLMVCIEHQLEIMYEESNGDVRFDLLSIKVNSVPSHLNDPYHLIDHVKHIVCIA
jgi:hypothetical protein